MFEFNVNNYMLVKLTNYGKELIVKKYGFGYFEERIEKNKRCDGYYEIQCHELMSLFGNNLFNGCKMPFEPTVRICAGDLKRVDESVQVKDIVPPCKTEDEHEWMCKGISSTGTHYVCKKCLAHKIVPYGLRLEPIK